MTSILSVVEGDGDMEAVPELVRRIAHEQQRFDIEILRPHKRGDLPKVRSRFEDYLQTALLEGCPVLWVLDYDCHDCDDIDRHHREMTERANGLKREVPVEFVFMVKEYETLFLADQATTRKVFPDIPADLAFPRDPERVRDAKGWLSEARPKGSAYKPTQHQKRLTSQLDLSVLRLSSPTFQRFESAVVRLIAVSA